MSKNHLSVFEKTAKIDPSLILDQNAQLMDRKGVIQTYRRVALQPTHGAYLYLR